MYLGKQNACFDLIASLCYSSKRANLLSHFFRFCRYFCHLKQYLFSWLPVTVSQFSSAFKVFPSCQRRHVWQSLWKKNQCATFHSRPHLQERCLSLNQIPSFTGKVVRFSCTGNFMVNLSFLHNFQHFRFSLIVSENVSYDEVTTTSRLNSYETEISSVPRYKWYTRIADVWGSCINLFY